MKFQNFSKIIKYVYTALFPVSYQINLTCHWSKVFDACVVMNTATLISIYFWDVKDIVLTLKRSETFETFIGIVKSYQEKILKLKKKKGFSREKIECINED